MKKHMTFYIIFIFLLLGVNAFSGFAAKTVKGDVALIHVNVIPMDKE